MKKQLIFGMLAITLTTGQVFAATTGAQVRANVSRYLETTLREDILGKDASGKVHVSASSLSAQAMKAATDKVISRLDLKSNEASALRTSLVADAAKGVTDAVVAKRFDSLIAMIAARQIANKMKAENDNVAEADAMLEASDVFIKVVANAVYKNRANDEIAVAVEKFQNMGETIALMNKADREMYTKVGKKMNEILDSGKTLDAGDALIEAIMAPGVVKKEGMSREKALEIIRKLKECK